jgi:hypothetical protein
MPIERGNVRIYWRALDKGAFGNETNFPRIDDPRRYARGQQRSQQQRRGLLFAGCDLSGHGIRTRCSEDG